MIQSTNFNSINNDIEQNADSNSIKNAEIYTNNSLNHSIVNIDIKNNEKTFEGEFIFVVDVSESMKGYIQQILNEIMPQVFNNLIFDDKKIIHLITFSNDSQYYKLTKKEFKHINVEQKVSTQMLGAVSKLEELINSFDKETFINLLVLTDGLIHDREETNKQLKEYIKELKKKDYKYINSKVIRFMSSKDANPNTQVLCSFLGFDTKLNFKLPLTFNPEEKKMSKKQIDEYVNIITKLFENQRSGFKIKGDGISLEPSSLLGKDYDSFELPFGKSIIFIRKSIDNESLKGYTIEDDNNMKIDINYKGTVTQDNLYNVYKDYFETKIQEVLNNKVIGNNEAINKNNELIEFIEKIEYETEGNRNYNNDANIVNILKEINKNEDIKNMKQDEINTFLNKKKDESIKYVKDLIIKIECNEEKIDLFFILDNSKYMKNNINGLLNKVIYEVVKKKYKDDKVKINILTFNSEDDDPQEENCSIDDLQEFQISCDGERDLNKCLEYLINKIEKINSNYHLFFIFSGEIRDKKKLFQLQFKLFTLNRNRKIISRVIKYIINKNDNFEKSTKDDDLYHALTLINSKKSFYINIILQSFEKEEEQIKKFEDLFW